MYDYIANSLKRAITLMRDKSNENRTIDYKSKRLGFTSLLKCPIKHQLKQEHPDVDKAVSVNIDDGFFFEDAFAPFLEKAFGEKVTKIEHDPSVNVTIKGQEISGHPDFIIHFETFTIVLEFKAPVFTHHYLDSDPDFVFPEDEFIFDTHNLVSVFPDYIEQAEMQKTCSEMFYNSPVFQCLFLKTTIMFGGKYKKVYILKPVEKGMSVDDIAKKVDDFHKKKEPRHPWECWLCAYKKKGLCDKTPKWGGPSEGILENQAFLLDKYSYLSTELQVTLQHLKNEMRDLTVMPDGTHAGWVTGETMEVNFERAYKHLGPSLFEYLEVPEVKHDIFWQKIKEIEESGKKVTRKSKERVFKVSLNSTE